MSTPCDMRSLIVWMIVAEITERETARKAMRCRREPRAMVRTGNSSREAKYRPCMGIERLC